MADVPERLAEMILCLPPGSSIRIFHMSDGSWIVKHYAPPGPTLRAEGLTLVDALLAPCTEETG